MGGGEEPLFAQEHLIAMPGGEWAVWRCACLRGAGFPASLVLRLAMSADATAMRDELIDAEERLERAKQRALDVLRSLGRTETATRAPEAIAAARKAKKLVEKGRAPIADTGTGADADLRAMREATDEVTNRAAAFHETFEATRMAISRSLRELAVDQRICEAVTWQNRSALETAFAPLLRTEVTGATPRTKERQHESLVARYIQRYCTKNDTIGFFGPVGWARWTHDAGDGDGGGNAATASIAVTPKPIDQRAAPAGLLATRAVYFEQWPIDLLATKLSNDPRLAPWMVPRRLPFVRLESRSDSEGATTTTVHSAMTGRRELARAQAALIEACDGTRTARELAEPLVRRKTFSDEQQVFRGLRDLHEAKLIVWSFDVPLTWNPDGALRELLARIENASLRAEALRPLEELEAKRQDVAAAAGDVNKLTSALTELGTTFTRVTGAPPTRQSGSTYAARQLVFEDCRRAGEVVLGPDLLAALGPPLSLILTSARWLTFEVARVYREGLHALYKDLVRRNRVSSSARGDARSDEVRLSDLWFSSQRVLFGAKARPLDGVLAQLQERWAKIVALPLPSSSSPPSGSPERAHRVSFRTEELRSRVDEAFAAPHAGWHAARHHSPDIMIAARSSEAIRRGDYMLVLGEIHTAFNTLDTALFAAQHPHPQELAEAFERDLRGEPRLLPVFSKEWPRITVRTNRAFFPPCDFVLETGFDPASGPRSRVVALSDLMVRQVDSGELVTEVHGRSIEIVEAFGETLKALVMSAFHMLPRNKHTPRVSIDRLVVSRESWSCTASELASAFASESNDEARFLAARRWARAEGVPRFVFAKSTIEVKPMFIDFDSPIFVNMLAKLARASNHDSNHDSDEHQLTLSEMLPGLDESWLPDQTGEHYTSEIRIVALDPRRGRRAT